MTNHFEITGNEDAVRKVELVTEADGITEYRISFEFPTERIPQETKIIFEVSPRDTYSLWDCRRIDQNKNWSGSLRTSRLGGDMPLLQLISKTDRNRYLFALSEVKLPTSIRRSYNYNTLCEKVELAFFTELVDPMSSFSCLLRVDERDIPFYEAIGDAKKWYGRLGYQCAYAPEEVKLPMYSTWYSYLTRVTAADVIKECRQAKDYGMDAVIIDDGWQRENGKTIYGLTGDWKPYPPKFPDMKALTDQLHAMGMKVILWFSVPFVGYFSENYKRFDGKYLSNEDNIDCSVLDPRYQEVREFIVETYRRCVTQWNLDGLKLDFIDRFRSNGRVAEGMDILSVEEAAYVLMEEIYQALTKLNPEIMIEFRQPYMGPVVTKFGNMIRVWDCPDDGYTNRLGVTNLRLATNCVVHSDMIRWNPEDTLQAVAVQLLATIFSVPQISVRFEELSPEQEKVLRTYLTFWKDHRKTLLDGKLKVAGAGNLYAYTEAESEEECIGLCASGNFVEVPSGKKSFLFNITEKDVLVTECASAHRASVYDCMGVQLEEQIFGPGIHKLPVPLGGMAEIQPLG